VNARAGFTLDGSAHSSLRRAAVALHGVEPDDQEWLLSQVDEDQRALLQAMLADLATLGLPRDRAVVEQVLRGSAPAKTPAAKESGPSPRNPDEQALFDVRSAQARAIARFLDDEPGAIAAHVVAHLPREKRSACIRMLSPAKRQMVQTLLDGYPLSSAGEPIECAPRLTKAVMREVAARLAKAPNEKPIWLRLSKRWRVRAVGLSS
jgi:hypothetical protein